MSKSFTSRLTGSARRPRRPFARISSGATKRPHRRHRKEAGVAAQAAPAFRPPEQDWLDCLDTAQERCRDIETLSGLLQGCGGDDLDGALIRGAGDMIGDQIRQLRALLKELETAR